MNIGVIKELHEDENRVAITPDTVKLFVKKGVKVYIEANAGLKAGFTNQEYEVSGAHIVSLDKVMEQNILLKINPPTENEVKNYNNYHKLFCQLNVFENKDILASLTQKGVEAYALELIPRISRAQSMDVLSSQSNLLGYIAVLSAAYESKLLFPMMMTAAGTIPPAKVTILGVGVAGLQAIATAKRLGAVVSAYDIRPETKEQTESLGAKFIDVSKSTNTDKNILEEHLIKQDIIITTATTIGKTPPVLVSQNILDNMKQGSLLIDLAVKPNSNGNIYASQYNQSIYYHGIKIIGRPLIQNVPKQASNLFAKNLYNFIIPHMKDDDLVINYDDAIIKATLVTKDNVVSKHIEENINSSKLTLQRKEN